MVHRCILVFAICCSVFDLFIYEKVKVMLMEKSLEADIKVELLPLIDSFNEITIKTDKLNKEWKREMDKQKLINEMNKKIDELKNEFSEKIAALDEKKPYEISYPKPKSKVYYINSYTGEIHCILLNVIDEEVKHLYELGLYFDTLEEAEQFKREQTLIKKIKCWAKEQQGDWKLDRDDEDTPKYDIYYSGTEMKLKTFDAYSINEFKKLPYFKSEEIAQACIDEFEDEILEVFC